MVSLQTADTAWMTFAEYETVPPSSMYLAPYKTTTPSYPTFEDTAVHSDAQVLDALGKYRSSFLSSYQQYPKAFGPDDRYTLFVPLASPLVDDLVRVRSENEDGFSHKNKKFSIEANARLERLLRRHMSPVKILPHQLEYRSTTIATLDQPISINQLGELVGHGVAKGNRVESYLTFPHATVFFITHELD